jgi:hypothetical protein
MTNTVKDFFPEQGAASRKSAVYKHVHEHLEASRNTVMGKKMNGKHIKCDGNSRTPITV